MNFTLSSKKITVWHHNSLVIDYTWQEYDTVEAWYGIFNPAYIQELVLYTDHL